MLISNTVTEFGRLAIDDRRLFSPHGKGVEADCVAKDFLQLGTPQKSTFCGRYVVGITEKRSFGGRLGLRSAN